MMTIQSALRHRSAPFILALAAAASVPACAADAPQAGAWQYSATIYGYLPSIGGKTTFPTGPGGGTGGSGGDSSGVSVSADQLISALKFAFMGTFDVNNGRWGVFNDAIYLNLGGGKSQSREFSLGNIGIPAGTNANLNLDVKGWLWTVAGEYRVASDADLTMDVLAGARYFDLQQTLKYEFTGDITGFPISGRAGSNEVSQTVWDGIVGVKGRFAFGDERKWNVPFYLDAGTGASKSTFQAAGGLGYSFKWGELLAMWRYLDYKFKSGKPIQDMNFNGPMIGATFRW